MSRSYTRNLNTVSLITLCPVCLHSFQDARRTTLRRANLRQQTKDVCTYCQTCYGFDYYAQPMVHRDPNRREAKAYAATAED